MFEDGMVCWLHLDDQHLVVCDDGNFVDLCAFVDQAKANRHEIDLVDFPCNIDERGAGCEYALAHEALHGPPTPVFAVPATRRRSGLSSRAVCLTLRASAEAAVCSATW